MADCECLPKCPFFNGKINPTDGLGAMYKRHYCLGDNSSCARLMVLRALGRDRVPPTLFPNQAEVAKKLIEEGHAAA